MLGIRLDSGRHIGDLVTCFVLNSEHVDATWRRDLCDVLKHPLFFAFHVFRLLYNLLLSSQPGGKLHFWGQEMNRKV